MKLIVGWRFPQDAGVQIELDGTLYFGEICYCRPEHGGFIIGIEVEQVLSGFSDLSRLRQWLAQGNVPNRLPENADTASGDHEHWQLRDLDRTRL